MKAILTLFCLTIVSINLVFSQDKLTSYLSDPYKQPVDMIIDVQNMKLNLVIEPFSQTIKGNQVITFKTLRFKVDSLVFYAPEMEFQNVSINGVKCEFKNNGSDIIVFNSAELKHNQPYEMLIEFTGNPTSGLYFSGWNDKTNRHRKQIWAHSPQGWMPFINQKPDLLTTEIVISFDSKYKVFSNGNRILEQKNNNGSTTWHYKMDKPHVIYLVCLVIGEYDYKKTQSSNGTPMELWYYPEHPEFFESTYAYSEYMIDFYEKEIGVQYPYSVYRQAPLVNYMYGGMETTTATVFGDYMQIPSRAWWMRNYVNVNSHELNHQWFGNFISHLNNRHTWLTESFATHYAKMFERDIFGEDYYQWERDKELTRTFNAAKVNNNPVAHSFAGTDRWYPKGSLVLDMIRDVLTDSLFRLAIKYYSSQQGFKVAETYDLQKAIRESTGMAMDWFFDQWLWRGGEPHFKVSYTQSSNSEKISSTIIEIDQIHNVDNLISYFKVPANVHIYYKEGTIDSSRTWIEGQKSIISIPNQSNKEIDFVIFDPNRKIIKKLTFDRSLKELLAQAEKAKNMIDRYDALLELRNFPVDSKRETFNKIYYNEKFHLNKSEIIKQLSDDKVSFKILQNAINDKDALVRRAVVENLTKVPVELKDSYIKLLSDSCYTNTEYAFRNLSSSYPNDNFLEQTKNEIGWRGKNIRMAWLEIALSKDNSNTKLFEELIDYTSISFEFETRLNALSVLKKLNLINQKVAINAVESYLHWNFKLSNAGFDFLKYMYQQVEGKLIIDEILAKNDFEKKQYPKIVNLIEKLKS